MARLLIDILYHYRREHKFLIHEFVLMRDHLHLLLTPSEIPLERAMQFVKGGFSYRVKKELGLSTEIWARGYVDHHIREADDYMRHLEYTRQNPIRAGVATTPDDYPYSCAHSGFELDPCPQGLKPSFLLTA